MLDKKIVRLDGKISSTRNTEEIAEQLGIRIGRTVSRHCALMCEVAHAAIANEEGNLINGAKIGLYCAIPDPLPDAKTVELIASCNDPGYKVLRKNVSPLSSLRSMSVVEAGWVSKVCDIRGPLRIFNDDEYGLTHAMEQAMVDLELGVIQSALVVEAKCETVPSPHESAIAYLFSNVTIGNEILSQIRKTKGS